MTSSENPVLSVVLAIVSDTTGRADARHAVACLEGFSTQLDDPPVELVFPHLEDVNGIEELKERFPHVSFFPVPGLKIAPGGGREHHDVLRARGLLAARGSLVALMEDHARPDERYCASIIAAHRENYAAIGGAIENDIDRALNWAVYFCDFGKYQNPLPSGESLFASDANVSYKRSALDAIRETWQTSFREVVVNGALRAKGEHVALRPEIIVYQQRSDLKLFAALRERFIWGRSYAGTRNALLDFPKRLTYALLSPVLPVVLMRRMFITAWKRRTRFRKFLRSIHLIVMLQISWSVGEGVGYLTGVRPTSDQPPD